MVNTIILCGGESRRMGIPKALITYHNLPQYLHLAKMAEPISNKVFLSINEGQKDLFIESNLIVDKYEFKGPINGLLSAFDFENNHSILLLGCDYAQLTLDDISLLLKEKEASNDVVCYYHKNENIAEPLVALYDQRCYELLLKYIDGKSNPNIQQFLKEVNVKKIFLKMPHNIISFDEK